MTSRKIQLTVAWLISASLIMGLAIWQAQVTVAQEAAARHRNPEPPKKTKHAIRPAFHSWFGDVVADYIERCKKGITDQEITWALEDYVNVGLDEKVASGMPLEKALIYRARQNRFLHDALADGLRLSREQSLEVRKNLAKLTETEIAGVMSVSDARQKEAAVFDMTHGWSWARHKELMPWDLCQLTDQQEKITWKEWAGLSDDQRNSSADSGHRPGISDEEDGKFLHSFPPVQPDLPVADNVFELPRSFQLVNLYLPLLVTQETLPDFDDPHADPFADPIEKAELENNIKLSRARLLGNVRKLTAPQLRILLLSDEGTAEELSSALAAEAK